MKAVVAKVLAFLILHDPRDDLGDAAQEDAHGQDGHVLLEVDPRCAGSASTGGHTEAGKSPRAAGLASFTSSGPLRSILSFPLSYVHSPLPMRTKPTQTAR